jgi:hypothetical protein
MLRRTLPALAALLLLSCAGKVLDGTCSPSGGQWTCEAFGDAGPPVQLSTCPSNAQPSGSCPSGVIGGGGSLGGSGFISAADFCLSCNSDGEGTYWACSGQSGWEARALYRCEP